MSEQKRIEDERKRDSVDFVGVSPLAAIRQWLDFNDMVQQHILRSCEMPKELLEPHEGQNYARIKSQA